MTLTLFVGIFLAAHRLTHFVIKDTLISRQREWLFKRYPPNDWYCSFVKRTTPSGLPYWEQYATAVRPKHKLGQLFNCPWCIGFWFSGAVVAAVNVFHPVELPFLWWAATSSAVGLVAKTLDR